MKEAKDNPILVMDMINQLADLNKIEDGDLMAGCFGVGIALLFTYQGNAGLKKCQDMLCEMTTVSWKRLEAAKKELGIED